MRDLTHWQLPVDDEEGRASEMLGDGRLLSQFEKDREAVRRRYQIFMLDAIGQSIWDSLRQQVYLGDEAFVERMQ